MGCGWKAEDRRKEQALYLSVNCWKQPLDPVEKGPGTLCRTLGSLLSTLTDRKVPRSQELETSRHQRERDQWYPKGTTTGSSTRKDITSPTLRVKEPKPKGESEI